MAAIHFGTLEITRMVHLVYQFPISAHFLMTKAGGSLSATAAGGEQLYIVEN
ncbi:hypothetical protein [Herbaspirillum sp. CF444]|uniref:hypothetical protein n=1 Tax=Herbaspirillum sp. CF444 TaxID=1144319 RepID=UPI001ED93922|nr:hypothetical protein [Herbaspirillum sp. CF444]